jgi:crotonobetainyl-CoA:carnitine CoA-transferase CaiB-like acyl-CoA transferase
MSGVEAPRYNPPPLLGEHSEAVLTEVLGFSPEEIARLKENKII